MALTADLGAMNREREAKLQRYKEKKALESQLKELKAAVDHPSCDDDVVRKFYMATVQVLDLILFNFIHYLYNS
jgi:hypothetical protein